MNAHVKAPSTPDVVAITLMRPKDVASMRSCVLAYKTAVPETVAIASDNKNHAAKNKTMSLRRRASFMVRHKDAQAYQIYRTHVRSSLGSLGLCERNGGPGRGRNHIAAGIVKMNHQAPIINNTTRRENVVWCKRNMTTIEVHCNNRPAE